MGVKSKERISKALLYLFLTVCVLIIVYPVIYAIASSFKTNLEILGGGGLLPKTWHLENYAEVWKRANFAVYTKNSLIICVFATIGGVNISSMTGYCLERTNFPGKKLLYAVYLGTMFIALGAVTLRPLYTLAVSVNLHNTLIPIILILIGSQGTNIFLVTKFVAGIPKELDEAASIDGCGKFRIYWNILLPLLKPILAVVALFQFRVAWNDFITSSVFTMMRPELRPLTVGVVQLKYGAGAASEYHLMMAGAAISIIPMLIVYFICNKYFMSGIMSGAVKG